MSRKSKPLYRLIAFLFLFTSFTTAVAGVVIQQGQQYASDEVLIKYRQGISSLQTNAIAQANGVASVHSFQTGPATASMSRWVRIKLRPGMSVEQAMAQFNNDASVELVEPNYVVSIVQTPDDPSYSSLWGLHNLGQTGGTQDADIDAPEAWDLSTGSSSVIVAVIDSGVDYNHPDLAANMWTNPGEIAGNGIDDDNNGYIDDINGYDFSNNDADPMDDNSHGSHVAGTIAAVGNNGVGVVGVSWNAQIMAVKFLNAAGSGFTSDAVSSVLYAANNGAHIMNNSWGGGGYSQALQDAITTANTTGALFVAAAGNSNSNNDIFPHYPANYSGQHIISVAATDASDGKAGFSSFGATTVHLGAPGVSILSTEPGNTYGYKNGTSMASPHVAGAAAVILAANPGMTNVQIKDRILNNVDPIPSMAGITITGGRLNLNNALIGGGNPNNPPVAVPGGPYNGVVGVPLLFDGSGSSDPDGDPLTYEWGIPPVAYLTGVQPTATFTNPGTYTISLRVNDGTVYSSWVSFTVTITTSANQPPVAVAGGPYSGVEGQLIQFDGTGSSDLDGDPLTYSWTLSDGRTLTGAQPSISFATAGSYTVTLVVSDGQASSAPSTATITVTPSTPNQPPVADAGGPYSGVEGQLIQFDGTGSSDPDGDPLTYSWTLSDGRTMTGAQPSISFATAGSYTVSLVVSDGQVNSPASVASITISAAPVNTPPVANPGGPYTGFVGVPVVFDGSGSTDADGDTLTYGWGIPPVVYLTGVSPSGTFNAPGTYTVWLKVNDGTVDSPWVSTTVIIQ